MMNNALSERIAILRILLITGVVVLHTPPYVPIESTGTTFFDFVKAFFQNAVFRCSVPMLTAISGYLLFSRNLDLDFHGLLKKKFKTLVVPMFMFSAPIVLTVKVLQSYGYGMGLSAQLAEADFFELISTTFGIAHSSVNYPLNFLRDLLTVSLLSPILGILIREIPLFGLAIIGLVQGFDLDGGLVVRNEMITIFYIGGLAAYYHWNLEKLDKYAPLMLSIFVCSCLYVVIFRIDDILWLKVLSPIAIWPSANLLIGTKLGQWMTQKTKYSFFIYLAHAPLLAMTGIFMPYMPEWLYWALAPTSTILILILLYDFSQAQYPRMFKFAMGYKTTNP